MNTTATTTPLPDEITAADLKTLLATDTPAVQLLDVRETLERWLGAIKPSAHIPLGKLDSPDAAALLAEQNLDPKKRTVIFCASGMRSLKALALLREKHNFTRAQSLRGGMRAWKSA